MKKNLLRIGLNVVVALSLIITIASCSRNTIHSDLISWHAKGQTNQRAYTQSRFCILSDRRI